MNRQHGVVTRPQLLALGVGEDAITRRIAAGRLHAVHRGVYAVGRPQLTLEGRWMAAVLSCGPAAALSHGSAAALWEISSARRGNIDVSVPVDVVRRTRGISVHRRSNLDDRHRRRHRGVPVTSPACTLVDLAASVGRDHLERAINEADKRDLISPEGLRRELDGLTNWPGAPALRRTLDRRTFTLTDSRLERLFLPIVRQAGLQLPLTRKS